MRARRITALTMAVLLGAGALAACSDDGGDGDDIALEDVGGSDSDADDTTTTAGDDDDDDDSSDTTLAVGDFAEGCAEFGEAFTALGNSLAGDVDESALDDLDEAIANAPEDFREDLENYVDIFRQYIEALEASGIDPQDPSTIDADSAEEFAELFEVFSSEEFLESNQAIQEFIASNCGG